MANKYKVKKVYDMPALKAYAIYVADDVKGITGPMDPLTDDARPVMANMTLTEANSYAKMLNSGETLGNVRYKRDYYRNMMYPRNN